MVFYEYKFSQSCKKMIRKFLFCFSFFCCWQVFADCIATSPDVCRQAVSNLNAKVNADRDKLSQVGALLDNIQFSLEGLDIAYYDMYYWNDRLFETIVEVVNLVPDLPSSTLESFFAVQAGLQLNAESALDHVYIIREATSGIRSQLDGVGEFVLAIDCSDCTNVPGSDGGGDCDQPSGGGGCPCEDAIAAAKAVLDSIYSKLNTWDTYLQYIRDIKNDVSDSKDYFLGEFRDYFQDIHDRGYAPNLLYECFSNATKFVTEGGATWSMLDKAFFINQPSGEYLKSYDEYKYLNWFSRIEFLLGEMVGMWSTTNTVSNVDFTSEQKQQFETVQEDGSWSQSSYQTSKGIIDSMIESTKDFLESVNPFGNAFQGLSKPNKITILPDVSVDSELLSNTIPSVEIDLTESGSGSLSLNSIIEFCHNLTKFFYFVAFTLLNIVAIWKFVCFLIFLNRWYWKVYHSWMATMFNGGGR